MTELNDQESELVLDDEVFKLLDDVVDSDQLDVPKLFQSIGGTLESFQQFLNQVNLAETPEAEQIVEELKSAVQQSNKPVVVTDHPKILVTYANFCRVSSTPEELILDLGLNPQPLDPAHTEVNVSQRIILNHYTAKRLLSALSMALQRHEQAFGVLETDIRKRVVR